MVNKLHTLKFALTGGIYCSAVGLIATIFAILNVPGFLPFAELMKQFYGPYGYSISWLGAIFGAFWGFVEGFVHIGLFGLVYNWLVKNN